MARASQKDVPIELRAIGNVEAYATVALKSRVAGMITGVQFKEGDDVAKGALLFTVDPRPFQASLAQAQANLARDLASANNAREQAKRYAALWQEGIVTREQYDQLQANADSLAASVASLRAAVDNAKLQLEYCFIRSPMAGRTGGLTTHPGNLVKENDTALVTINQIAPLYVTFALPEKDLATIKGRIGGKLPVQARVAGSAVAEQGTVTFLDNGVDPATGTIKVKATFANARKTLWPGQFVNVAITLDTRKGATVVPTRAVQTGQQGEFVYLVKPDSTAEVRPVSTGPSLDGLTLIEKGLVPGDTVVTDGQVKLVPGGKVAVKGGAPS
ncbi:efflux RND transporter periplasmic adaptor subunit [Geomonas nitrogeniifigens]|uniref:Efflux RND transporter periplasmic adaptor subunit n=1 Tax=Geomonas diazotrophica TaxID=2843197 RepID=A0ABX8JMK4_9BACT|nr:efflux RND transporter periplasmic adaptor subunit [Geomonas nitrogeniifigens]QWV99604.1 efflux RND transporter periplasmic adaptor subunit [Geomonas nitrogeniifigens]QXE88777.1 efflux RND transporter periplasmic adaptor subunit [Geomonas nitrogeniifigens]